MYLHIVSAVWCSRPVIGSLLTTQRRHVLGAARPARIHLRAAEEEHSFGHLAVHPRTDEHEEEAEDCGHWNQQQDILRRQTEVHQHLGD